MSEQDRLAQAALIVAAGLLAACGGGGGDGDVPAESGQPEMYLPAPTGIAPANHLDLSHWMLTLPVDSAGGTSGVARNVSTGELLNGYSSDWFYGSENQGVTFWAPINGAKTSNSLYARSELREMLDPNDASVNWAYTDPAQLDATLRINQVPLANGKLTLGQILGYNGSNPDISDLMKLVYEYNSGPRTARLYALVRNSPAAGATSVTLPIVEGLRMADPLSYRIRTEAGRLTISSGGGSQTVEIDPAWAGVGLYFRAGVSLHAAGPSATDGGRVTFYQLSVTH